MAETAVSFPNLGINLNISSVAFYIGDMPIYWYGICIGVGMILAVLFAFRQAPRFGVDQDRMIDVILIGFVLAIIGGRLYYVLFSDIEYTSFWQLIDLRSGGIAIYGGIIGAFIGAFIGCKWRKVPIMPLFDLGGMGFLIGQCLGRWGNFFNQEAFGTNTDGPFGMLSARTTAYLRDHQYELALQGVDVDPTKPVHPTFLYESLWCLLGFILLWRYIKHRKFNGEIFLFYLIWYGLGRSVIEGLRTDSLMSVGGGFRVSQVLAIGCVVVGLGIWAYIRFFRKRGQPLVVPEIPPHTAKVRLPEADGGGEVLISWPATDKPPRREERLEMAKKVLAEEKAAAEGKPAAGDGEDETKPDEKAGAMKPKEAAETAEAADGEAAADEEDEPASSARNTAEKAEDSAENDDE